MSYVVPPPPLPSVAVAGTIERFPVRRIFCVGRNYAAHAREMGQNDREPPFFFTKPADAVLDAGEEADARVPYPPLTSDFQHEVELAVAIGTGGADIAADAALGHVFGYAVALDLTRRDLQTAARDKGRPWDWGKAFDHSAPISPLLPVSRAGHPSRGRIWLSVDGTVRQDADLSDMTWGVPAIIAAVSAAVRLAPGDLILTGTPAGVGPLAPGQRVHAGITGLHDARIAITER